METAIEPPTHSTDAQAVEKLIAGRARVETELSKVIIGQKEVVEQILLAGVNDMPGCLSYIVAKDPADADAIWITEVWDGWRLCDLAWACGLRGPPSTPGLA